MRFSYSFLCCCCLVTKERLLRKMRSRKRRYKNETEEGTGSGRRASSSDNCYSVRCEPGGARRPPATDNSKTPPVSAVSEENGGYDVIGLPPIMLQRMSGAESRPPRIARRPPLPIDRRPLSMQGGANGSGVAGPGERGRVPGTSSRHGSRSTVSSSRGVNAGIDADVRQLIDEVRTFTTSATFKPHSSYPSSIFPYAFFPSPFSPRLFSRASFLWLSLQVFIPRNKFKILHCCT